MTRTVERFVASVMAAALVMAVATCKDPRREPAVATDTQQIGLPMASPGGRQQRIPAMRQRADRDPGNARGWAALGDEYFDSQQREKAIEAYDRALRIEPDNPDVLTDQGVMYRELGAFDKAKANFEKAGTINPKHLPSLLDLGVLYAQDLNDPRKAIETWNRLIQIAPASPQAAKAQVYIEQLNHIPKPR